MSGNYTNARRDARAMYRDALVEKDNDVDVFVIGALQQFIHGLECARRHGTDVDPDRLQVTLGLLDAYGDVVRPTAIDLYDEHIFANLGKL